MSIEETAAKLEKYKKRVKQGQAHKIKPKHVEHIREKLHHKRDALDARMAHATDDKEREHVARARATVDRLVDRADWLRNQI